MPIYEFICEECGEIFEELVPSLQATKDVSCPACQSDLVRKLVSSFVSKTASDQLSFFSYKASRSCNTGST
jgi:putative FmdB family regulatory protein